MMRIIAGGKKHQSWVAEAVEGYQKRMKKPYIYDWVFCNEDKLEAKATSLDPQAFVVLLDESGTELTSPKLVQVLQDQITNNRDVLFIIGGAYGHFSDAITTRANLNLSLSKMVFPHQICRLILAEQLYRAQQIALDHPYHHA